MAISIFVIPFLVLWINVLGYFYKFFEKNEAIVEQLVYKKIYEEVEIFKEKKKTNVQKFVSDLDKISEPLYNLRNGKRYFYYLLMSSIILGLLSVSYDVIPAPFNVALIAVGFYPVLFELIYTIMMLSWISKLSIYTSKNKEAENNEKG